MFILAQVASSSSPLATAQQFLPIVAIFVIFYFLVIRPQQKQQKELQKLVNNAKVGDAVILTSGIHGKIAETPDKNVKVTVATNVTLTLEKSAIAQVLNAKV